MIHVFHLSFQGKLRGLPVSTQNTSSPFPPPPSSPSHFPSGSSLAVVWHFFFMVLTSLLLRPAVRLWTSRNMDIFIIVANSLSWGQWTEGERWAGGGDEEEEGERLFCLAKHTMWKSGWRGKRSWKYIWKWLRWLWHSWPPEASAVVSKCLDLCLNHLSEWKSSARTKENRK